MRLFGLKYLCFGIVLFAFGGCRGGDDADKTGTGGSAEPREPSVIMTELAALPTVYIQQGSSEEVLLNEAAGNPTVRDSAVCWEAMTCGNLECPKAGQDFWFTLEVPGYSVDSNGRLVLPLPQPGRKAVLKAPAKCPQCGSADHLEPYLPPDLKQRKKDLEVELAKSRMINRRAKN